MKLQISHRIIFVALFPFLAYLFAAIFLLSGIEDESNIYQSMEYNGTLYSACSGLINDLQKERGKTSLYLAGGTTRDELNGLQSNTDASIKSFLLALSNARLDTQAIQSVRSVSGTISAMRKSYQEANSDLRQNSIKEYSQLIQSLLQLEKRISNSKTTGGFGKVFSSILIIETAKESAGKLRANVSGLLALNAPLTPEQFELVVTLKSEVDANLASPAITLGKKVDQQISELHKKQAWIEANSSVGSVLLKSSTGNFGITGDHFFQVMSLKIDDLALLIQKELDTQTALIREKQKASNNLAMFGIIGTILLTFVLGWLALRLARDTHKRIQSGVISLKDISEGEGDLTQRLDARSDDELGQLARWFNIFAQKIQSLISQVSENSFTLASASTELLSISEQTSQGAEESKHRSEAVAAATEEMSVSISTVSAGMGQASTNLAQVNASTKEMVRTSKAIQSSTDKAAHATQQATKHAEGFAALTASLGSIVQEIGHVTESISDISEQTNLLALNATIEAATAGEAGKGFAVVAKEVKDLAKQTSEATSDIRNKIAGIQSVTDSVQVGMQQMANLIVEINSIVAEIDVAIDQQSSSIENVAKQINEANAGIQDVTKSVSQMALVSRDISKDIAEVSQTAQITSTASEQVKKSARELSNVSEQIKVLLGRFKV
jgi:methyl-accepting chemotaxis protein